MISGFLKKTFQTSKKMNLVEGIKKRHIVHGSNSRYFYVEIVLYSEHLNWFPIRRSSFKSGSLGVSSMEVMLES